MRWLALLARIIGWLLTPLVVWAASFLGAWFGTWFAAGLPNPRSGLYVTVGSGLVAGLAMALIWMRILRRSRRLRHSLHVTPEGLPILDEVLTPEVKTEAPADRPASMESPPA